MRVAPSHGLLFVVALLGGCGESTMTEDAGGLDAAVDDARASDDAPRLDATGLDAFVVEPPFDAPGLDALALDALGTDAPGLDVGSLDVGSLEVGSADGSADDAFGPDAFGADAHAVDAFGIDAVSRDANGDVGSRLDRCTAGCDHLTSCGLSGCASFGIDCTMVDEERACVVDCLRGYACGDVSGIGFSNCSATCRAPVDAAYPDVFASDTRGDSGSVSDRCTAGCDYLLACGFSTCSTLGVDCTMGTENQACLADCLRGFACVDVPGVGFAYCQDQCAGTVDAGPPNDAGPGPAACTSCAMASCGSDLSACLADDTCEALVLCVSTCTDTTCRDDCLTRHPATPALRDPVLSCLCTRCAGPCTQVDPCAIL